jgi:hypothetical protein
MAIETLTRIIFNKETGNYSIEEAGFKYEVPESLYESLKRFILQYDFVSRWYKQLNDRDLQKVNKISAYA